MFVVGVYLVSGLEQGGPSFLKIHQAFLFFSFNSAFLRAQCLSGCETATISQEQHTANFSCDPSLESSR